MKKSKKNVLNEVPEEPKEELNVVVPEEVVEELEKNHGIDVIEEVKKIAEEELTQEDIEMDKYDMTVHSDVHPPIEVEPKIVFTNDPIEIDLMKDKKEDGEKEEEVIEKPKPRTIESLSHKEYNLFLRTGQMPK
jgi:hypothetical protein